MCFTKAHEDTDDSKKGESSIQSPWRLARTSKERRNIRASSISENPKFLVIGAGAAGIACAVKLLDNGFRNVVLVDAESRIGGRINTIEFADNVVDMGAQWCHGEANNNVHELVQDLNLLESTGNIYMNFQCIRSNGEVVSDDIVKRLKDVLARIFMNRHSDLREFSGSFGSYLSEHFYNELMHEDYLDIDPTIATEFFENFKKIESSETAAGVDEVSAKGFDEYWECEGDYLLNWRDKGYIEFLRVLTGANTIGNDYGVLEDRILFNTRISEIQWDRTDSKVEVVCDKTRHNFVVDHVIITCSLGVLKKCANTMFEPELPQSKTRAIEGLGYGSVCKIFLEFEQPFWKSDWSGFTTLWQEKDYQEIRGSHNAWVEDIYGFYRVNYQPRVLICWIVGRFVEHVEKLQTEAVKDGCMYLLRRFLPTLNITEPLNIAITDWQKNPNFNGSYSFRSMNTEKVGTSATELAQPLTILTDAPTFIDETTTATTVQALSVKPVVLFAGEATSSHHYGTVHGAVESGRREAARLVGYYSLDL